MIKVHYTNCNIDLDAFKFNLEYYRNLTNKKVMVILKGNAYGHGDVMLGKKANEWGYDFFGVANLAEAIHLRRNGVHGNILVLAPVSKELIEDAINNDITLTIPSLEYALSLDRKYPKLKCHIKVDTGMNRIGIKHQQDLNETIEILKDKDINIEGIFSHYYLVTKDNQYVFKQYEMFKQLVDNTNYDFKYKHLANSDGAITFKEDYTNMIRPGISLYGYSEVETIFKPVMSIYSTITVCKKVNKGETVGYGATYLCDKDTYIGTIPIGYADGIDRRFNQRYVYIGNTKCNFAGRICMDQSMIELDKEYPPGTKVEIVGPHISMKKIAEELDTNPHEIMNRISNRVVRKYYENGKVIDVDLVRFKYD